MFMYIIILAINCHSLFCLWVVSPLQCRSSILVLILFIYVIYVTNHQLLFRKTASLFNNRVSSLLRSQINLLFGLRCSKFLQLSWMYISNVALSVSIVFMIWTPCYICIILYLYNIYFYVYHNISYKLP
jgi:hypothetical protein